MRTRSDVLEMTALAIVSTAADLTVPVMPLVIAALVSNHHLTDTAVGLVATAQLVATALLAMVLAPHVGRLRARATIAAGAALVIAGNVCTLVSFSLPALVAARLIAGCGAALTYAVVSTLVARRRDPDAGFAAICAGLTLGALLVFLVAPSLATRMGEDAVFWVLGLLPALGLLWLPAIPERVSRAPDNAGAGSARGLGALLTPRIVLFLVGIVGLNVAGNLVFMFCARIGAGIGVGYGAFAHMMIWVSVSTAVGPVAARFAGARFSRASILVVAATMIALSAPLTAAGGNPAMFFLGLNLGGFALMLGLPSCFGLLAEVDREGRLATFSRGVQTIAIAVTPGIASLALLGGASFARLGYLAAIGGVVSLLLMLPAMRKDDRPYRGMDNMMEQGRFV